MPAPASEDLASCYIVQRRKGKLDLLILVKLMRLSFIMYSCYHVNLDLGAAALQCYVPPT
jgi:hypothetical protein